VLDGMRAAALALARSIGYESAGTVEFIYDQDRQTFYFMEMNTRVQVEHPVTEMITGIDIVEQQLRIAAGEKLGIAQDDVRMAGYAVECRINAESPRHAFRPSPGKIEVWDAPEGEGIRVDTHCYPGSVVPPFYDSLLAKIVVRGTDRHAAAERMTGALDAFTVSGVETTLPLLRYVLRRSDFLAGPVNTRWLERCAQDFSGVNAGLS
jgi:acetyl-CoA carboxylase biotin carboxylase subunit